MNIFTEQQIHQLLIVFIWVFTLSYVFFPLIRRVIISLKIKNNVLSRSSHQGYVPNFGGIVFFMSYFSVFFLIPEFRASNTTFVLLAAMAVIFVTGFLDDLINLSPKLKLVGQLLSASIVLVEPQLTIHSLYGFLGIYEISFFYSVVGTVFFLVLLINAFNLIDGIDGLTAITGIVISLFYSLVFFKASQFLFFAICITNIAMLLAFLRYNFSKRKKIFMGDTGSLLLGLVLGILTIRIMSLNLTALNTFSFPQQKVPLMLIAILFIPILDTFRVMSIRYLNGKPIFEADRNHLHHILIDFGFSHRRVSLGIGVFNTITAIFMFFVVKYLSFFVALIILGFLFLLSAGFLFWINKNRSAIRKKIKLKNKFTLFF